MESDSFSKTEEQRQILAFEVGTEEMGMDLSCVREVLRTQEVYPLSKASKFIEGVIDLRGHLVPLIDLGKRLHDGEVEKIPNQRIIVCKINKFVVGLAVSGVKGIVTVREEEVEAAPELATNPMEPEVITSLVKAGRRIIPVLNLDRVIPVRRSEEGVTAKP